ncbi:ATP-binding protein [Sagittula salina]|uniref:histidine kinase n=1 Tax=Sagittula salina TaxID=2820268 RepID=A0A940MNT5_9RHOB|nr:ATP-binding protein [Sagittula salina]MBP0482026.1 response regulator [Sagittula salina]
MIAVFILHVLFFSGIALALTILPRPSRAVSLYAYLSVILIIGGFLGNAYSLPITDDVTVSGGNIVYGAFMLTSILFVLVERDVFIIRRVIVLVAAVDAFNILLSSLVTRSIGTPGIINPHGTPAALFESSISLILLGGVLIILELSVMLILFEWIKRFSLSQTVVGAAYLTTFVAILCFDGIAFPLIAFGTAPEVIAIVFGGFTGKFLTATSYSLAILAFMAIFPARFSAYLKDNVFTWRMLLSSSSEIIRDLEDKDALLTKSQSRLAHSAQLAGLGYAIADIATGRIVESDDAYANMHGMSAKDIDGLDIDRDMIGILVLDDDREKATALRERLKNGETVTGELRHVLPGGEVRSLRKIFSPFDPEWKTSTLYEVVGQDVTETRQLQERLFQAQKMDAIGKLTGGIAHDFNNLLAVTMGNLELLDDELTDPEQKSLIQNCLNSTKRGAELTRNMLSFARKARLETTVVNLNQIVRDSGNWVSRTLPSTIEVETALAPDLWPIEIDAASTESSLLNLTLNARDAMQKGGKLTITTANAIIAENSDEARDLDITPGRYVVLTVSDTGEGISPEKMKNIFDPFYTTKGVGKGSGLGLSMVDGFMQQSGGVVRVTSQVGVGTTFRLFFRASDVLLTARPAAPEGPSKTVTAGKPKILLAEDNVDVLFAIRRTLEKHGYQVIESTSGDDAFRAYEQHPDMDLLLTDIVMPGDLQGDALAAALRELRPDLPVVFMSGNADEDPVNSSVAQSNDVRLMKPVTREALLSAVGAMLKNEKKTKD